jgi:adhesin transport system outer membrane protein
MGGTNDLGMPQQVLADDEIITGSLGPPPNLLDDTAPDGLSADLTDVALADGPALRLAPSGGGLPSPVANADPFNLASAAGPGTVVQAMADVNELGLRASTSPVSLQPPAREQTAAPEIVETEFAGAVDAQIELAGAEMLIDEPPARPTFDDRISVSADPGTGPVMTLSEVVSRAATMHPEVTLALARVEEARAGVDRARSGLGPQVDVTLAAGQVASGVYSPSVHDIDGRTGDAAMRVDGTLRLRQLLFDFNATRDQVLSTLAASDAARLRTIDVTEDIALRTSQAYLRILQQRQLLALIDRNIQEHLRLLEIVELNEADGNSTRADVNRISARLSEVRSARTDLAAELDGAEDVFERLARIQPGRLLPPEPVVSLLAPSADDAIDRARSGNPRLLSLAYNIRSLQHELDVVNGDGGARIDLELEANSQNYFSDSSRSENDVRGMVVFSYSLFDGGDSAGQQRQVESRIRQARARYTDGRDQVEADIRQAYRAIASARRKLDDLRSGLSSSREVQSLYTEQFQAGERTIFELLDAQNALFSAERDLIVSQFSELEAAYSILRSTGRLTSALLNSA